MLESHAVRPPLLSPPSAGGPVRPMLLLQPFAQQLLALLSDSAAVAQVVTEAEERYRWRFVGLVALAYANIGDCPISFNSVSVSVCDLAAAACGPDAELCRLEALMLRLQAASFVDGPLQQDVIRELEGCALYQRIMAGKQRLSHVVLPHSVMARMPMEHALYQWRFGRFQDALRTVERCAALQRHCRGPPPLLPPASLLFAACFQVRTLLSFGRHPATIAALAAALPRPAQ